MRLGRPIKQCERVWQLCIEENVLRPVPGGYSAIEWMREKGYFNDDWKYRNQAPPRQYTNNGNRGNTSNTKIF